MSAALSQIPVWGWVAGALIVGFVLGRGSRGAAGGETAEERGAITASNLARLSSSARSGAEEALTRRNTIEAVKIVRADLGAGLRDSKDVVDALRSLNKGLGG